MTCKRMNKTSGGYTVSSLAGLIRPVIPTSSFFFQRPTLLLRRGRVLTEDSVGSRVKGPVQQTHTLKRHASLLLINTEASCMFFGIGGPAVKPDAEMEVELVRY